MTKIIKKVYIILTEPSCLLNLIYLIISILGNINTFFYSLLLLDILRRSQTLVNILKSVTLNASQLLKTTILGIFIMIIFAYVAFLVFPEDFDSTGDADMNLYCDSLWMCFVSVGATGIRAGGGVG